MALRREALHVGMLVPDRKYILFDFILSCFVLRLLPAGHEVRPEAIDITSAFWCDSNTTSFRVLVSKPENLHAVIRP